MLIFCAWHPSGRKFLGQKDPFEDKNHTDGMCAECEARVNAEIDARANDEKI